MSIDYEPKIIIGTDIDSVTIDDDEIDDLLDDEYYDEANNKNYQEFTKKEKQKAKEQYQ